MTTKKRRRVIDSAYLPLSNTMIRKKQNDHTKFCKNERRMDAALSLTFSSINQLDEVKFEELSELFPMVKKLDLSKCYNIPDYTIALIGQKWGKNLVDLNLKYCALSDNNLASILGGDPLQLKKAYEESEGTLQLRNINLSHSGITDLGIRFIALRSKYLTNIDLSCCNNITDLSLSMIAQYCKQISSLNVSGCNISNYGVQLIAQECKSNLNVLDMNDCAQITDETLFYLCHFCPNLKRLRIRGNRVTTIGISQIIARHALLEFNVHGLTINDDLLRQISYHQIQLDKLDISFCRQVTITGIESVLKSCRLLKELHLFGINFSSNEMETMRSQAPLLKILC